MQLMAGVKNPIYRLLKKAARILTVGLEQKAVYMSKDAKNLNWLRKIGFQAKNIAGYPIRFIIPMLVLSPFIAKIATKGSDAIFGKPTKSVLDEDKEPEKEAENKNKAQSTPATQEQKPINPNNIKSDTNLIKQAALEAEANKTQNNADKSHQADTNKTANSEDSKSIAKDETSSNKDTNNTTNTRANSTTETNKTDTNAPVNGESGKNSIENANNNQAEQGKASTTTTTKTTTETSTDGKDKKDSGKEMEPVRTYVPSPVSKVKKASPDTSAIDSALAEADAAEKYIQSVLAENSK